MIPIRLYLYDEQTLLCSFFLRTLLEYNRILRVAKSEGLLISKEEWISSND